MCAQLTAPATKNTTAASRSLSMQISLREVLGRRSMAEENRPSEAQARVVFARRKFPATHSTSITSIKTLPESLKIDLDFVFPLGERAWGSGLGERAFGSDSGS